MDKSTRLSATIFVSTSAIVVVFELTGVEDILTGIGFNAVGVRSSQQPGENLYEFLLFLGGAASPVRS